MLSKKLISRVIACSILGLGFVPAIAHTVRAESIPFTVNEAPQVESVPFTVIHVSDSYFCRNKNKCTAVVESAEGERYRINYGAVAAIEDGDRVLIETQGQTWSRIRHPETGRVAVILSHGSISR